MRRPVAPRERLDDATAMARPYREGHPRPRRRSIAPMTAADLIDRYLAAAQRNDWDAMYAFYADDIEFHVPGRSAVAGRQSGKPAVRRYMEQITGRLGEDHVEVELIDRLESPERVALVLRERIRGIDIRRVNVYRVAGEKIVEIEIYEADQYEVDELLDGP